MWTAGLTDVQIDWAICVLCIVDWVAACGRVYLDPQEVWDKAKFQKGLRKLLGYVVYLSLIAIVKRLGWPSVDVATGFGMLAQAQIVKVEVESIVRNAGELVKGDDGKLSQKLTAVAEKLQPPPAPALPEPEAGQQV